MKRHTTSPRLAPSGRSASQGGASGGSASRGAASRAVLVLGFVVTAVSPGCSCDDDLELLPGSLGGAICDEATGAPARGIEVVAIDAEGESFTVTTDVNSGFLFEELAPGRAELSSDAWNTLRVEEVQIIPADHLEWDDLGCRPQLPPPPDPEPEPEPPPPPTYGGIASCLCDVAGETPLSGATITLTGGDGLVFPMVADEAGCFSADEVPTGTWQVDIVSDEGEQSVTVEVLEGEVAALPSPPRCERCLVPGEIAPLSQLASTDIIWIVDNSGSMEWEENTIQQNLNSWSNRIEMSGIDHHVVMLSDATHITVPPPLGGSASFLAVDVGINSTNALQRFLDQWESIRPFLRAGSIKHFIVVSDDDSDLSAPDFLNAVAALTEPSFGVPGVNWFFHSIVGYGAVPVIGCIPASATGTEYIELSETTGGVLAKICETDWSPIFDALEAAVLETAINCSIDMPSDTADYTVDPADITLHVGENMGVGALAPVDPAVGCIGEGGWYLSDGTVIACPSLCEQAVDEDQVIGVDFGCTWVE